MFKNLEGLIPGDTIKLKDMEVGKLYLSYLSIGRPNNIIPVTIERSKNENKYDIITVTTLKKEPNGALVFAPSKNETGESFSLIKYIIGDGLIKIVENVWKDSLNDKLYAEVLSTIDNLQEVCISDLSNELVRLFGDVLFPVGDEHLSIAYMII